VLVVYTRQIVAQGEMVFETLSSIEEFDSLATEWDELVRAMPKPTPFLLHGWVRAWLRHYARDAEPAIHVARQNGQLVAALPLVVRRRFGLRLASFVGDDHPFVDMLLASGESLETASALAEHAAQSHDCASLGMISAESVIAKTCGKRLRLVPRVDSPILDLDRGYETVYREKYSGKARQNQRRLLRRLSEIGKVEFVLAKTPEELMPALEEAFRIHALRWQERYDGSTFRTSAGQDFNRDALQALAKFGVARILTMKLDGRAIAFNSYFVLSGRMFGYRLAFDPAYAHSSPGVLSLLATIERAADEGITAVELLGDTEQHKLGLTDRVERLYEGIGLTGGIRGASYARARAFFLALRLRVKRIPILHRLYLKHIGPGLLRARDSRDE